MNIPKAMLVYLGWLAGEEVVCELLEDATIRLRPLSIADFPTPRTMRAVPIDPTSSTR